jgi:hypothetical protein
VKKKQWIIIRKNRGRTRVIKSLEGGSQDLVMYLRDNDLGDLRNIQVFPEAMFNERFKKGKKGWWVLIKLIKKDHDTKRKGVRGTKTGGRKRAT